MVLFGPGLGSATISRPSIQRFILPFADLLAFTGLPSSQIPKSGLSGSAVLRIQRSVPGRISCTFSFSDDMIVTVHARRFERANIRFRSVSGNLLDSIHGATAVFACAADSLRSCNRIGPLGSTSVPTPIVDLRKSMDVE